MDPTEEIQPESAKRSTRLVLAPLVVGAVVMLVVSFIAIQRIFDPIVGCHQRTAEVVGVDLGFGELPRCNYDDGESRAVVSLERRSLAGVDVVWALFGSSVLFGISVVVALWLLIAGYRRRGKSIDGS